MKTIPTAILSRIVKLGLILLAALVLGIICGTAAKDRIMLLLTLALAVAGGIKLVTLYASIKKQEYDIADGVIRSAKRIPVRKCQTLILVNEEGSETSITLKGWSALPIGSNCRLYLSREIPADMRLLQAERLKPARILLGYEVLR